MSERLCIGVDLGGTKIEAVALRLGSEPDVLARQRVATGSADGYEAIVERARQLVAAVAADAGLDANAPVGVGCRARSV